MSIQVTIRNVYGNETIYPACETAKSFAKLVGQKTLTHRDLTIIKGMGYAIEVQTAKVVL